MTHGYDVDRFRNSTATSDHLYEQGQSLGYSIVSQRIDCSSKPIIFMAHGLGGLICQQTLILSNTIDGLWHISSSCLGIIFMGTPHYGYSLASYGEKLSKCMNKVYSVNSESVETLHTSWDDIQRVRNDFQLMLHRGDLSVRIFCFYEAIQMNDIVGKIVDDQSAVLRGYENCRIDADHFNMAKFSGQTDRSYGSVRSIISKWIQEPESDSSTNQYSLLFRRDSNPCPSWLLPLDTEPFTDSISGESGTEYNTLSNCLHL